MYSLSSFLIIKYTKYLVFITAMVLIVTENSSRIFLGFRGRRIKRCWTFNTLSVCSQTGGKVKIFNPRRYLIVFSSTGRWKGRETRPEPIGSNLNFLPGEGGRNLSLGMSPKSI